ncbi:Protein FIZZY-RELATED 3 [Linum perenne]
METPPRRKSGLNLPAGMNQTSLRLETLSKQSPSPSSPGAAAFRVVSVSSPREIASLSSPSSKSSTCGDRFIPCRSSSRLHTFGLLDKPVAGSPVKEGGSGGSDTTYARLLKCELFGSDFGSSSPAGLGSPNMLRFKNDHSGGPNSPYSPSILRQDSGGSNEGSTPPKPSRKVPKTPHKVLDAPSLQDDFYLNVVDWSSQNVLAVGLGTCVYLWSASNSKVTKLCDLGPNDSVCSVQWTKEGSYISVGTHFGQVCGLKWSHDDRELASGGNDNQLLVWNQHSQQPILKLTEHTAAVKAIAWSPHQSGLLASGGGTADRCIRFWNTTSGNQLNHIDTGSQVCNLGWSKNVNELVSTHGYSQNQIMVWKYPSLSKVATLTGHSLRVLYLAMSPDGQTIVTGAGDETLRFWNVFPSMKTPAPVKDTGLWSLGRTHIR